jgi:hypothetical protein
MREAGQHVLQCHTLVYGPACGVTALRVRMCKKSQGTGMVFGLCALGLCPYADLTYSDLV